MMNGNFMLAIRVMNLLADNIHITDKIENRKLTFRDKQRISKEFEFTEAVRTDDLRAIVEHINNCNRHAYRTMYGKEPESDYLTLTVNDNYYRQVAETECPSCAFRFRYERNPSGATMVKCPSCGKEGVIR